MTRSIARVETEHGSRYLQQLCKHWRHKFTVEFDAASGLVPFDRDSSLLLAADERGLTMTIDVSGDGPTAHLEGVVADHLRRFSFRETLDIGWQPAG